MKLLPPCALLLAYMHETSAFFAPTNAFRASSSVLGKQHQLGSPSAVGVQERGSASRYGVCFMVAGGRTPFIAGNWKMNPLDLAEAKYLAKKVILPLFPALEPCLRDKTRHFISTNLATICMCYQYPYCSGLTSTAPEFIIYSGVQKWNRKKRRETSKCICFCR